MLLGFCTGTIAALFGVGGGVITTPFLHALGLPMPFAVAWSSPVIACNAITSTVSNARSAKIEWRCGLIFGLVMIPSLEVSARFIQWAFTQTSGTIDMVLRLLFVGMMLVSLFIFTRKEHPKAKPHDPNHPSIWMRLSPVPGMSLLRLVMTATVAGCFAGLLGLGGGRVIVPALLLAALPHKTAIATSSMIISLSSTFTMISYGSKGMVDLAVVPWMLASAIVGALLGSFSMRRMNLKLLKRLYLLLTFMGLSTMGLKQFGFDQLAVILLMGCAIILILVAYLSLFWRRPAPVPPEATPS